jgi:hypothetical protein
VDNNAKPAAFRRPTAGEFARLSASMQLAIHVIRRAQLSSRSAVAATAQGKAPKPKV